MATPDPGTAPPLLFFVSLLTSLSMMVLFIPMLAFLPYLVVLLLLLSIFDKKLGLRVVFVQGLIKIFEWGASLDVEEGEDEIVEDNYGNKKVLRKRPSSSNLAIISREKSEIIDEKLHSTDTPPAKQSTIGVLVDDTLEFITAGIESIIQDDVTSRFKAAELPSWNLLTRTSTPFQHISWKLTLLWAAGMFIRYVFIVPVRIIIWAIGMINMVILTAVIGALPNSKFKKFLNRHAMLASMRIMSRAFSAIINFHDRENRATHGGICVANHTSPIDVLMLSCDNCYAMIGQRQGGILGFIQKTLSKAEHHIWFERSEASDRKKVTQRLREHVEDSSKLPIIIFPEGTCINNTSVMMFKKGSFEIGSTIYPIAMKYDNRLTDAFWNSSEQSYGAYLWRMMTSWAIICDVWYLPPMHREEDEDAITFSRRVKKAIAKKGGLIDLEWDGMLKRQKVSDKLVQLQQKLYYQRLERTTTLADMKEKEDILQIVETLTAEDRDKLCDEINEGDDDTEVMRKVSQFVPTPTGKVKSA